MNLIEDIKKMVSGEVLSKLTGLMGESESKTSASLAAAIPAMLSGVSNLASSDSGLGKLSSVLKGLDTTGLSNPAQMLSGGGLMEKGTQILGGLFGNSVLGSLGGVLGNFTGLGTGKVGNLLGLLAPLVLGQLAKSWTGGGGSPAGLKSLIDSQKSNIQAAIPPGLNLGDTFKSVSANMPAAPSGGGLGRLLPIIIGLLALAGVIWFIMNQKVTEVDKGTPPITGKSSKNGTAEAVEDPIKTSTETFTKYFDGLKSTIEGVKDPATADSALRNLNELSTQADGFKSILEKVPAAGKDGIITMLKGQLGTIKELVAKVMLIPGVGEKLKPIVEPLLAKLGGLVG
jgi:hypothetical protein